MISLKGDEKIIEINLQSRQLIKHHERDNILVAMITNNVNPHPKSFTHVSEDLVIDLFSKLLFCITKGNLHQSFFHRFNSRIKSSSCWFYKMKDTQ